MIKMIQVRVFPSPTAMLPYQLDPKGDPGLEAVYHLGAGAGASYIEIWKGFWPPSSWGNAIKSVGMHPTINVCLHIPLKETQREIL